MNTHDTFKLPVGHFDSIGWLAFATAYAANGFLDKLRALMDENAGLTERCAVLRQEGEDNFEKYRQAEGRLAMSRQETAVAEARWHAAARDIEKLQGNLKSANKRNAEKILNAKKKKK